MKIAAVLFILSVYYIASTEQAAGPAGVHTYPRSWEEMQHKARQGMKNFKMNAEAYPRAKAAQVNIPTNLQELQQCANKDCPGGKESLTLITHYASEHACTTLYTMHVSKFFCIDSRGFL